MKDCVIVCNELHEKKKSVEWFVYQGVLNAFLCEIRGILKN